MNRRVRRWLWAAGLLVIAATAFWYGSRPRPLSVTVTEAELGPVRETVANTRAGTVKACHRARLSPPMGGQIAALPVKEGDRVTAGQLLLELWNEDLEARVLLAERDVRAARDRAEEVCTAADVARREATRISRLHEKGLASEEDEDVASGESHARAAACRAAKSGIRVSQAQVTVAEAALARTRLNAPFDGIVAEVNGEVGEFVTPSPVGIPTPPAVDLVDISCLYIAAPIDEVDAPAIRTGMLAEVTLDAFPRRNFPGTVRRVAPYVLDLEKQARTVEIEAELDPGAAQGLLPGYSADVEVIIDDRDESLRVPTQAIIEGERVLVYVPDSGVLESRDVETGLSNWEHTEIRAGLAAGETVVTSVDREGVAAGVAVVLE